MSSLHIKILETSTAVVVRLEGDAGFKAVETLDVPLRRIVAARPSLVVFDMTGLLYAASLFLGSLVNFRRGIVYGGGKVQMAGVQPNIRELFQSTGLEELFEFIATAPEATAPSPAESS
jgi:anti-anti-sigma factor